MEYFVSIWAFLGFLAFIKVCSLQSKVSKIERKLRENDNCWDNGDREDDHLQDLRESLQKRIGKYVEFDFYEEENPVFYSFDKIQISDVDEKWVLLHAENKNKKIDKLVRISSIRGVKE